MSRNSSPDEHDISLLGILGGAALFKGVHSEDVGALAREGKRRRIAAKTLVFDRGNAGSSLFIILGGGVKAWSMSADGKEIIFDLLGPGDTFGEMSVLDGKPRISAITTLIDSDVVELDRAVFLSFLRRSAMTSLNLSLLLAQRLRQMDHFLEDVLFLNAEARLAKRLIVLSRIYGENQKKGSIHISLRISQQEIANLTGITRESVNKQFKAWDTANIARIESGRIIIDDLARLQRIAAE